MSNARVKDEEFQPLPDAELEALIRKGAEDARELDAAIRSQFELTAEDAALVLR